MLKVHKKNISVILFYLKLTLLAKKLTPLYHGPYEVTEINSKENSTIKITNKTRKVHNNHLN